MDRQATRNAWRLFNLRESPFFQEPLQAGTRFPMSLFVGRTTDTNRLLNKIARSPGSSRQTVRGAIGVGKSTLAQHLKAEVVQDGILSTPAPVSVSSALTVDQLCALVLRSVLDALVGTTPQKPAVQRRLEKAPAVQQASQLVRIYQATTGQGGGVNVIGFGAGCLLRAASVSYCPFRDVIHKEMVLPAQSAESADMDWARNRAVPWNAAEHVGLQRNSRLAREVLVILPHERTSAPADRLRAGSGPVKRTRPTIEHEPIECPRRFMLHRTTTVAIAFLLTRRRISAVA